MLTISGVTKTVGGRCLFEDVTMQVNREDRLGLVGPNGAGKTTLFSLVLGQQEPDQGTIALQRGTTLGYLPQESTPVGDETVLELALGLHPELPGWHRQLRLAEAAGADEAQLDDIRQHFAEHDGFLLEAKAKRLLGFLGFRERDFDRPCRELSGGWVMRAHLGRLLVQEPDILMLDEPTNHLDLETLLWFQRYLQTYPGAIAVISHDREFLNQLVTTVLEIRQGQLLRYRGNYDSYLGQRAAFEEQQLAAYKNQQREIGRLMDFVDRFRAKASKASQAQSKLKQIERMDRIEAPTSADATIRFHFPQPPRSGLKVIRMENIHHAYGPQVVYQGMEFEAERDQRIVLVGPNGAGKSTLLKLIAGVLPVQSGTRELGHNVRLGYFAQYRVATLNPERSVLEEAFDTPQRLTEQSVRTVLGSFLFRGDDVFKQVKVLSGGEKSRLALVKLLLDPPNLLLMDEPTTHLDIPSIDALVGAMQQFQGTVIFISHDVYFIRAIANRVVHVQSGRLTHYAGPYDYYLEKSAATSARSALTASTPTPSAAPVRPEERPVPPKNKEQKRLEAEERQARAKLRREQQRHVEKLEAAIAELEERQKTLTDELERPDTYERSGRAMEINRELMDIVDRLPELTAEWEAAASRLADLNPPAA